MKEQSVEDLATRLERERLEADRAYNAALTALDAALPAIPKLPTPPAPFDAAMLTAINRAWDILPAGAPPADRSLKGRLRSFIWRIVGPPLETQRQFNASLVDHLNRNAPQHEDLPRTVAALLLAVRSEFERLVRFESLLVQYLQAITAYVDTRDRSLGSAELRERLAIAEQRLLALRQEMEAMRATAPLSTSTAGHRADESRPAVPQNQDHATPADDVAYVGFEDRFRGPQREIRRRVEDYLPILSSASDVLDVGCGRGELLDLLQQHGVHARGVDANTSMIELCRSRGLSAEAGDALAYLERQPDGSIGGLTAIQVVEHFSPLYLARFLDQAHRTMRPGAPLVLETINPACWMAFFETYIRDLTHHHPLHPETLRYMVQASGFRDADVQFRQPVGEGDRLERVESGTTAELAHLTRAINAHADKLNSRLFSSMDYAVIARR